MLRIMVHPHCLVYSPSTGCRAHRTLAERSRAYVLTSLCLSCFDRKGKNAITVTNSARLAGTFLCRSSDSCCATRLAVPIISVRAVRSGVGKRSKRSREHYIRFSSPSSTTSRAKDFRPKLGCFHKKSGFLFCIIF